MGKFGQEMNFQFSTVEEIDTMYKTALGELEKKYLGTRVAFLISAKQLEALKEDYQQWLSSISSPA